MMCSVPQPKEDIDDDIPTWRCRSLIDFADVRAGHRLYDLVSMHIDVFRCNPSQLHIFLQAYVSLFIEMTLSLLALELPHSSDIPFSILVAQVRSGLATCLDFRGHVLGDPTPFEKMSVFYFPALPGMFGNAVMGRDRQPRVSCGVPRADSICCSELFLRITPLKCGLCLFFVNSHLAFA